MQIEQNYFTLFGLPESFHIDKAQLSERYRALQRELHPDRHAHAGDREQRLAVQYTAHLNDAQATLKSPLKRALYLLQLRGHPVRDDDRRPMAPEFLMQQMLLREELEEVAASADPDSALEQLQKHVAEVRKQLEAEFVHHLEAADEAALLAAVDRVRELQFIDKMQREIEQLEERLADY
ncbi:Fe-S protein assembly co-chaperone HscB [Motiliproteus sediminis]|uniref:Fe-S protein assembly co-chaperone HscB n=1 Tax=Motiliproteus sediminis TaxID=1468178 RepID=UPI001AEFC9B4|nr:Fe-S protein assembly co-chaperone HscB [Motiliproteus sediminis]